MELVSMFLLFAIGMLNASDKSSVRNIDPDILEIAKMEATRYWVEGCGICKNRGSHVPWSSPSGCFAHKECFIQIQKIEAPISAILTERCANNDIKYFNEHRELIGLMQNKITPEGFSSIKEYHDRKGDVSLKSMYESSLNEMLSKK